MIASVKVKSRRGRPLWGAQGTFTLFFFLILSPEHESEGFQPRRIRESNPSMRLAAFLMSPVSGAASDNKWPSKQQAEQQPGYTHASTMRKNNNKSIPLTRTASFCTLNNLTPHSVKGDFYFMPCTYSYTDFFAVETQTLQGEKNIFQIVPLRKREREINISSMYSTK